MFVYCVVNIRCGVLYTLYSEVNLPLLWFGCEVYMQHTLVEAKEQYICMFVEQQLLVHNLVVSN